MNDTNDARSEGRPYRSHLHPACFSCRKRKSRCKTRNTSAICIMCQAHSTECIFPRSDDPHPRVAAGSPRKSPASTRRRLAHYRQRGVQATLCPIQHASHQSSDLMAAQKEPTVQVPAPPTHLMDHLPTSKPPNEEKRAETPPNLMSIVTEAGDNSSHIVSPAVADDNDILESYLSAVPAAQSRYLVRTSQTSDRPLRPVRFNVVPRRPLGVAANQSLAASKCEVIEKYLDPNIDEFLNLFFQKANPCFPLFDEASFRSAYSLNKEKISSALLCNLYANALVYWRGSTKLCSSRTPDIRFIWNQANEALHSELFLSPGLSTVMSILINVCGRPSTSMFGNGGMVGTAVALSNALGLNRDPSTWSISPLEKSLRVRIWWLVVMQDRWCSLAYGTPLQVHRAQYDVPYPSVDDLCLAGASSYHMSAASVFVALTTLTDILARYLEHVYCVSKSAASTVEMTTMDLERILSDWEESLTDEIRRLVLRGTRLDVPGAANLRLAYLAVKLLLRRIQLDLCKNSTQVEDDRTELYHMNAERAAEEIAHFLQELDETQLRGFWIPVHAFSITSATMFLLRSGLRARHQGHNTSLKIAKDMINTLQSHHRNFDWDLADNCLANCGELVEKIGGGQADSESSLPDIQDFSEPWDIDPSILDELFFGITGLAQGFDI